MEVYTSIFQSIFYDKDLSLMQIVWTDKTVNMTNNHFQKELNEYLNLANIFLPETLLIDLSDWNFTISVAQKLWIDSNIAAFEKQFIKKQAIIYPNKPVDKISIKQMLKAENSSQIETLFFYKTVDAIIWLTKD